MRKLLPPIPSLDHIPTSRTEYATSRARRMFGRTKIYRKSDCTTQANISKYYISYRANPIRVHTWASMLNEGLDLAETGYGTIFVGDLCFYLDIPCVCSSKCSGQLSIEMGCSNLI